MTQPSRPSTTSSITNKGDTPSAFQVSSNAPARDAFRRDILAWLKHNNMCFAFACAGQCNRPQCPCNHDESLVAAGYYNVTQAQKRGSTTSHSIAGPSPRKQRKLYALSDEQLELLAAVGGYDVEDVRQEDNMAEF